MANYKVVDADQLDSDLQIVGDAIREKTGGTDLLEFPQEMKQAILDIPTGGSEEEYNKGYTAGQQAEYDAFWDANQQNGNKTNYNRAYTCGWYDENFNPKYPITGNCTYAFSQNGSGMSRFTRISVDIIPTDLQYAFYYSPYIVTIKKIIVTEDLEYKGSFQGMNGLKDITFEGVIGKSIAFAQSSLLTTESVQSIIDHLADLTGQTAQTVTFHSNVLVTAEQRAQALAKNWNIVGGKEE